MSKTPINIYKRTYIYTLSDPDTKIIRYIGKTVKTLEQRLSSHIYSCKKENNYRTNWIKSLLIKGKKPIIELLDECNWIESQFVEQYWISQFKSWGFSLVNLTEGGEGNIGRNISNNNLNKLIKTNSKKVYQYDLEGNYIQSFSSCQEAANYLNLKSNSKIAMCARGSRKMCNGYQWSYNKLNNIGKYKRDYYNKGIKLNKEKRDMVVKNLKGYGKYFI